MKQGWCSEECIEAVSRAIDSGAAVDERDDDDQTALMLSALTGQGELAALLLKQGADPLAREPRGGTPGHMAAAMGNSALLDQLFDAVGARMVEAVNERGQTPLHVAAREGQPGAVETLLRLGADTSAKDKMGRTPEREAENQAQQRPERDSGQWAAIKALRAAPTPEERRQMLAEKAAASKTRKRRRRKKAKQKEEL